MELRAKEHATNVSKNSVERQAKTRTITNMNAQFRVELQPPSWSKCLTKPPFVVKRLQRKHTPEKPKTLGIRNTATPTKNHNSWPQEGPRTVCRCKTAVCICFRCKHHTRTQTSCMQGIQGTEAPTRHQKHLKKIRPIMHNILRDCDANKKATSMRNR